MSENEVRAKLKRACVLGGVNVERAQFQAKPGPNLFAADQVNNNYQPDTIYVAMHADEVSLLKAELSNYASSGTFNFDETVKALKLLDCPLPGHEIRKIVDVKGVAEVNLDESAFADLLVKAREIRDMGKVKQDVLKGFQDAISQSSSHAKHTYSHAEELGYTNWINQYLGQDKDCLEVGTLPIVYEKHELFSKMEDGLILCKMVNLASPNTIHENTISRGKALKSLFNKIQNLTLGINSAAAIGCYVVNIGETDIREGRPHLILGLIWQLIKKMIVETITLSKHAALASLLNEGETLDDLNRLSPEELLLRWVNFQLRRAGCDRTMRNFNTDIQDSVIYSALLNQVAPDNLKSKLIQPAVTQAKSSMEDRAQDICTNATAMDVGSLLQPSTIYDQAGHDKDKERLNIGFVAELFNKYPSLDPPKDVDTEAFTETLEEKTYRNWMNSLGVQPYVNHLYTDLSDGLVLLQLVDGIEPKTVDWTKVCKTFEERKVIYQKSSNCSLFVDHAKTIGLKLVNISGTDIVNMEKKLVLGTCFQLMRAYLYKILGKVCTTQNVLNDEKEILKWLNDTLAAAGEEVRHVPSFRDAMLRDSVVMCQALDAITPGSTDRAMLTGDHFQNAVYAISVARKQGALVYALPEHVVAGDGKMIMTIFLSLMIFASGG